MPRSPPTPYAAAMRRLGSSPSADEIEAIARAALEALPETFRQSLGDLVLMVEDFADDETLEAMGIEDPFDLTGIYEGVPLTERFTDGKDGLIFSAPYYVMRQVVVSPALGAVRSPDDLRGKLVGVQAMTLSDHMVFERGYPRRIYLNPGETFTALLRGEVDAIVMESPLAGWFVKRNPGFRVTELNEPTRDLKIGAAIRSGDPELCGVGGDIGWGVAATELDDRDCLTLAVHAARELVQLPDLRGRE